jgi:hypothetical protein
MGLNYLGFTTSKNPCEYRGSGKYWKLHLKCHKINNKDVETIILCETDDKEELRKIGTHYSELYDIVKSNEWANLIFETGEGVHGFCPSEETRKRIGEASRRRKHGKATDETRDKISNSKKGVSIKGKEIIDLETGFVFSSIREVSVAYNLNENILKKSIYKKWNKRFVYTDEALYDKPKRIRKGGRKFSERARDNISKGHANTKSVRHIESGKEFKSISEASKFFGIKRDTLTKQLYFKRKCGFEYA